MDTGKTYYDSEGNECSIWQVVRREPDWAANRVQEGEIAIAKVDELRSVLKTLLDAHEMSCVDWPAMRKAKELLDT